MPRGAMYEVPGVGAVFPPLALPPHALPSRGRPGGARREERRQGVERALAEPLFPNTVMFATEKCTELQLSVGLSPALGTCWSG